MKNHFHKIAGWVLITIVLAEVFSQFRFHRRPRRLSSGTGFQPVSAQAKACGYKKAAF